MQGSSAKIERNEIQNQELQHKETHRKGPWQRSSSRIQSKDPASIYILREDPTQGPNVKIQRNCPLNRSNVKRSSVKRPSIRAPCATTSNAKSSVQIQRRDAH
eukprot:6595196-Pyramimonas_sp.AAC.1